MNTNQALASFLTPIIANIVEPALLFLFFLAFVYFAWGVFKLIQNAASPEERVIGQKHIMWSVVGMFIMIGAYGIIRLIANTLNVPAPF